MKAFLTFALTCGLLAVSAPAQAADERPCVSKVEFHGAKGTWTKAETEERWDVAGLGERRYVDFFGTAWVYPRCAYAISDAFYAVRYENGTGLYYVAWKIEGAEPHGRP